MTVRVGLCSTAHVHAEGYAALLAEMAEVEFVGVAHDDHDAAAVAESVDVPVREQGELLEVADAVIVASTNTNRQTWIEPAAAAGVDVLAEKPLATTVDEAQRLADLCADVTLGVAMPLRHSVPAARARSLVADDAIGDLVAISGCNRGLLPGGWFQDPEAAGGGAVMDHTVHIVDLVQWLTGERVTEIYAETATRFHDGPLEDVNHLSMTLSDGTVFSLDGSWSKPEEFRFWGDATVELVGTEGTISLDCFAETARLTESGDGESALYLGVDPNERMLAEFVAAVRDGTGQVTPAAAGVDAVRVLEAAYESADQERPVSIDRTDARF